VCPYLRAPLGATPPSQETRVGAIQRLPYQLPEGGHLSPPTGVDVVWNQQNGVDRMGLQRPLRRGTRLRRRTRSLPPVASSWVPSDELEIPESLEMAADEPRQSKRTADAIVHAVIEVALTPALSRRLGSKESLAVTVLVPSPAWVNPVETYWKRRFGENWHVLGRDGSSRWEHKSSVGNAAISGVLLEGRSIMGVAPTAGILPSALIASSDVTLLLRTPNADVLAQILAVHFGKKVSFEHSAIGAGLDFHDFVAAFRDRSTPDQVIDRIRRATQRTIEPTGDENRLPSLETAFEYGEARQWALDLAQDIADYRAGRIRWSDIPRGLVLFGESGTGKTLFAKMVARYLNLPLIAFSIADLFGKSEGALGDVVQATNSIFTRAAAATPCITFLDELDALPDRATLSARGRDWWLPVCANFLVKLDGAFSAERAGNIFIGATNYISRIDAALLRPGRFERAIEISRPDLRGTINILRHHAPEVAENELSELGQMVGGSTGAELMMLARDARRNARREARELCAEDLRAAALSERVQPDKMRRICVHEAGHAVGALVLLPGAVRGIVVRSQKGGAARTLLANEDADIPTCTTLEARVVVALSGRAAERLLLGEASVGAGGNEDSDLAFATRTVASLHASAGLGDKIVFVADLDRALKAVRRDKSLRRRVDRHLADLQERADELVARNRETISAVADALADTRYLSAEAIQNIFEANPRGRKKG
jgi:cell division protease FtsH